MFKIIFYEDKNGKCELQRYLIELKRKADNGNKNARINFNEILYLIFDYPHKHYTFKHFEI